MVETTLFILAIVAAGLFCPTMMWWQRQRGKDAACRMPTVRDDGAATKPAADVDELRREHERLTARIAELELHEPSRPPSRPFPGAPL